MKAQDEIESKLTNLPSCAAEFIKLVIKKMRYRRKVRADVMAELAAHFEDELKDCTNDEERQQKAERLIGDFGDAKLLAVLLRRAKKRCRPLWRTAVVRSFQALGIIVLYILICLSRLGIGTPTISVNYVDWLNELVRAGRDETKNARPYYEEAAKVCVTIPKEMYEIERASPADLNDAEIQVFQQWINDNKEAIELVRKGTKKPYCWPTYRSNEMELLQNDMKSLSDYRNIARALHCRIRYEAYKGDIESALSDCAIMQKFGGHLQGTGLLAEQLVGIAIEALAHGGAYLVLEKADVPTEVLRDFREELEEVYRGQKAVINLEAEKALWYDLVQRGFTDDGEGSGRVLKRGLPLVIGDWKDGVWGFVTWSYPDRREVTNTIDACFQRAEDLLGNTPWELHTKGLESEGWNQIAGNCFMLKTVGPGLAKVGQIGSRLKTSRTALLTVLSILIYEKDNENCPANLDELVEGGYLKELPLDPFSNKPLIYKKSEDDFVLYSVGLNFTDDGGQVYKVHRGDEERAIQWAGEGDAVFWPVTK
jgi:hypothetical protein